MVNALTRIGRRVPGARARCAARSPRPCRRRCRPPSSPPRSSICPQESSAAIDHELDADVLVCADDPGAAEATVRLVGSMPGLRGVVAGLARLCERRRGAHGGAAQREHPLQVPRRAPPDGSPPGLARGRHAERCGSTTLLGARSSRSSPGTIVTMYTCGITPVRLGASRPRRDVPHLRRAAAAPARPRPRDPLRAQRHRRRRRHPAQGPRARRALPRPRGGARSRALRRRHGGARPAAGLLRAAGDVGHPGHPRLHRHGPRHRATPIRRAARCTSTCRRSRASAS